jgi:hypothetical protein
MTAGGRAGSWLAHPFEHRAQRADLFAVLGPVAGTLRRDRAIVRIL